MMIMTRMIINKKKKKTFRVVYMCEVIKWSLGDR